jgi:phenylalanyl-tRNA synthetase beta chain
MPTIEVKAERLYKKLGFSLEKEELELFLFEYGLELDDIVSDREKKFRETNEVDLTLSDEKILKIEVPANRYDLLCEEGIARALSIFKGKQEVPDYRLVDTDFKIYVEDSVVGVRDYVVCGVLRGIDFGNEDVYNNFISLQTKLHTTVCRKRSLASIGTHDLDTIKGPFYYRAKNPLDIEFAPLDRNVKVNGHQLMELLKDTHLGPFLDIIKEKPLYPVIYDSNNVVLSLPPIINGDHSKITRNTKNVLIEVTATDLTKANIVLNTVVTMFSEYCTPKPFSIEKVTTIYPNKQESYPSFEERCVDVDVEYLNKGIGIEIDPDTMVKLLVQMSIPSKLSKDKKKLTATIIPTRSDIFHKCDLVEDIAIAYGFNKIPFRTPTTNTIGGQSRVNYLADKLRNEVARSGYTELLTFSLLSTDENFKNMNLVPDGTAVVIANPATIEFQVARTSLLPGILKTLESNKEVPLPLRVFEVSDVLLIDNTTEVGARNRRQLCSVYCDTSSGFEVIHGLLNRIMSSLQYTWKDNIKGYILVPSSSPTFLEGRRGDIIALVNGKKTHIGTLGVLHPKVVTNFQLLCACSALLLDVEFFVDN